RARCLWRNRHLRSQALGIRRRAERTRHLQRRTNPMTHFDTDRRDRRRASGRARNALRFHHPDFDKMQLRGWRAAQAEKDIPGGGWEKERQWALKMGLPGADSIDDKSIPTFARGELPH